jgi:hypothetical protein
VAEGAGELEPGIDRLRPMEAVFIGLMALVVLLTGYVSLLVLYKLFKAEN